MVRWLTAGESHGQSLVAVVEGIPSHVAVTTDDVSEALARRRLGYGRGARMKFEADKVTLLGGIRHGETQGGPIAIEIGNTEWPKWETVMSADPVDAEVLAAQARNAPLTRPRPGHADLVGMQKYDFDEARPVLERASARETAARVALGRVATNFLHQAYGITLVSHVVELGPVRAPAGLLPTFADRDAIDADPLRCFDPETAARMVTEVDDCHKAGDTLGGVVEVVVWGLPPGLGSHVHGDRRLDARLAGALMGIQAIKGVEVGDGFELARSRGSKAHDEILIGEDGIARASHRAGGTEGGMSTGEVLRVRAAMKPIATVPRALRTVDVSTGEPAAAHHQRSDVCAVPAAGVVAEAMVALVLADAAVEKFGGDSVGETRRNHDAYLADVKQRGLAVRASQEHAAGRAEGDG
ncbi:chorismate synthase [Propionibacteriaceae bacterium Y2011]